MSLSECFKDQSKDSKGDRRPHKKESKEKHYAFWKQLSESATLSKKDLAAHTAQLHENQAMSMTHGAKPHESYAIQLQFHAQKQHLCDKTAQPW